MSGDGALRPHLETLARRLGVAWAVRFTGWVGADRLPEALAGLDIVVNTSLRSVTAYSIVIAYSIVYSVQHGFV